MDAVQAPIVAVIGDLIRQVPGTISLGPGRRALRPAAGGARRGRATRWPTPTTHEYQDGAGTAGARRRDRAQAARARTASTSARGSRVMVTAGAQHGVHARGARDHRARATKSSCRCRSTSTTRWRFRWPAAAGAACRPTSAISSISTPSARAITPRTRAIVTVSPNNPSGAVLPEAALREVNELCRERGLYHISDEVYEYFTYGSARARVAGRVRRRARAHDLAVLAVEGLRLRRLAHRLHGVSGARWTTRWRRCRTRSSSARRSLSQVAAVAAMEVGPAYCQPHVRELAEIRDIVARRAARARAAVHGAAGRRRVLLLPARQRRRRSDGDRRAADPRAPRRGHSRARRSG